MMRFNRKNKALTLPERIRLWNGKSDNTLMIASSFPIFAVGAMLVFSIFIPDISDSKVVTAIVSGFSFIALAAMFAISGITLLKRDKRRAFASYDELLGILDKFKSFNLPPMVLARILETADKGERFSNANTFTYVNNGELKTYGIRLEDGLYNLYDTSNGVIVSTVNLDKVETVVESENEVIEDTETSSPQLWQTLGS